MILRINFGIFSRFLISVSNVNIPVLRKSCILEIGFDRVYLQSQMYVLTLEEKLLRQDEITIRINCSKHYWVLFVIMAAYELCKCKCGRFHIGTVCPRPC